MLRQVALFLTVGLLWGPLANAAIDVPSEYTTLQAAIDAASQGDTVLVAPGTYTGPGNYNVSLSGKNIVIQSAAGPQATIFDAQGEAGDNRRVLQITSSEDSTCVISGLTMRGGYLTSQFGHGAGVLIAASPTIQNCIVEENYSGGGGGGVSVFGSARPRFIDCVLRNNVSVSSGGGLRANGSSGVTLVNVQVEGNSAAGIKLSDDATASIISSRILGNTSVGLNISSIGPVTCIDTVISGNTSNTGAGIHLNNALLSLVGCTITGNVSSSTAGGVYWWGSGDGLLVERSILWGNCAPSDPEGVFVDVPTFRCSVVDTLAFNDPIDFDGPQVSEDPEFCAAPECGDAPTAEGDLSVQPTSPALPENNPCGVLIGALGPGCVVTGFTGWPSLEATVRVSPNPVNGSASFIELQGAPAGDLWVEIFDAAGKRLQGTEAIRVEAGDVRLVLERPLSSGVYFARVRSYAQTTDARFVVLR